MEAGVDINNNTAHESKKWRVVVPRAYTVFVVQSSVDSP
jgi:transcription elongation GreA/GreB family factor